MKILFYIKNKWSDMARDYGNEIELTVMKNDDYLVNDLLIKYNFEILMTCSSIL